MKKRVQNILDRVTKRGVQFADVRLTVTDSENFAFERGSLKDYGLSQDNISIGIRVLVGGVFGFAGTNDLSERSIDAAISAAFRNAEESRRFRRSAIEFPAQKAVVGSRVIAPKEDPFAMSYADKIGWFMPIVQGLTGGKRTIYSRFEAEFRRQYKIYANSEGTFVETTRWHVNPEMSVLASDGNAVMSRTWPGMMAARAGGFEVMRDFAFPEHVETIIAEADQLLDAPRIEEERADLIIGGSQLALQLHESVGHATEADRIFGMEISYAGKTFVKPEHIGKLRYGSPQMTVVADSTDETGIGFNLTDDDGVPAKRATIIKEGLLVDLQTSRETAALLGLEPSSNMLAVHGSDIPLIRMNNLNLLPGKAGTLKDLIADTEKGYLIDLTKTWSIDDSRNNFQFTTEIGWKIEQGKITGIVKEPTYYGITTEFWNSCDAVCSESEWKYWGTFFCGKGEPGQAMQLSHKTAPARFRNVVVNVKA